MQLALGLTLREDATFSNYVSGPNAECVDYLKRITGDYYERSVYLWGPRGTGKSHLLQAVCHYAAECDVSSIFLPLSEMVGTSAEILASLEDYSLVCLDDIEAIAGNRKWEEALFHLYNRMLESKTSLIVTGQHPLQQTPLKLSDLISRLSWGIAYQLKPLSDEDKMRALQMKASVKGLDLSGAVAAYLIRHCSRDLADLFEILNKLDHASLVAQRKLTIPFIKEIL